MNNNVSVNQGVIISHLKEMYDSNNRVLTSITQTTNTNFNNDNNIGLLVNNLTNSNNEIMRNIINLLNTNNRNHNRNQSNTHQNNRRQSNRQYNNDYINESIYNYPNSSAADTRMSNLIYSFLEPIEIFPTPSQIESATRVARFGDIINPLNTSCPISLENFNENDQVLIIRHCDHIFSNPGLISWFRTNCRCPVCRYDIRNYVSTHPNNVSDLSGNTETNTNVLSSPLSSSERRVRNNSSNVLVDLIFSNLLDISGNNVASNNSISDVSENLLHLFFRPH
jgi:hypothetical protein